MHLAATPSLRCCTVGPPKEETHCCQLEQQAIEVKLETVNLQKAEAFEREHVSNLDEGKGAKAAVKKAEKEAKAATSELDVQRSKTQLHVLQAEKSTQAALLLVHQIAEREQELLSAMSDEEKASYHTQHDEATTKYKEHCAELGLEVKPPPKPEKARGVVAVKVAAAGEEAVHNESCAIPDIDLLFSAILNNDSQACQKLIEQRVCVNTIDAVHDTPLVKLLRHHRSDADSNSIVKQLIDAKADVNALCNDGRCILELALGAQHTEQHEARHGPHVYPASIALQLIDAGQLHTP